MPSDSTTSKSLPASACGPISITQWQSDWQQDTSSTYNPLAVSLSGLSANQEIHGPAQSVLAYEDSGTAGTITSKLTVNGTTVSTLTSSPSSFSLDTLLIRTALIRSASPERIAAVTPTLTLKVSM